jgi:hypothetical protein
MIYRRYVGEFFVRDVESGGTERQPHKLVKQILIVVRINIQMNREAEHA